mmetsp:Transcript_9150/g.27534  ORF Transcript_9150/g.27534 Transcript_9150/m.27534 type:complete len:716 (+) Transcript_9150:88-2235(+)
MVRPHKKNVGLSPFEMHKLEQEQKQSQAKAETEAVYEDFVKSFEVDEEEAETKRKTGGLAFVSGGTSFGGKENDSDEDDRLRLKPKKRELYLPPSMTGKKLPPKPQKRPILAEDDEEEVVIPKTKRRAIDDLVEDIKKKQEARDRIGVSDLPPAAVSEKKGSFDAGDPTTTNIFVGNLSPDVNEEELMRMFGSYGPIASMKIMWPRTEEERARGHISGFIAFMDRADAEAAHDSLRRQTLDGRELRLAWGRAVSRPSFPLPAPAGMEYGGSALRVYEPDEAMTRADKSKTGTRIVAPLDLVRRREINILAAYVARDGYEFELAVREKERTKGSVSRFKFLFDPNEADSAEGQYYKWRVFSLLQGDKDSQWRTAPFAYVPGGREIYPPTCGRPVNNPKLEGEEDTERIRAAETGGPGGVAADDKDLSIMDSQMKDDEVKQLTQLLRGITWKKKSVAEAMVFCIGRATCAGDIVSIITESLTLAETPMAQKIARLFLVSDILHNSSVAQVKNAWAYRSRFQLVLEEIFASLGASYRSIVGRMTANAMRTQIERVLGAWERWSLYAPETLEKCRLLFTSDMKGASDNVEQIAPEPKPDDAVAEVETEKLSNLQQKQKNNATQQAKSTEPVGSVASADGENIDGKDIDGEDIDGEDIDGEDIDGEDIDGKDIDGKDIDGEDIDGESMAPDDIDGEPLQDEDVDGEPIDDEQLDGEPTDA